MDAEKYRVAIETHKFYDTISNYIVGGQIAITGASFFIYEKIKGTVVDYLIFMLTGICVLIILLIYRHCARYANVARNVAADLEEDKITHGVSVAYKTGSHEANKKWNRGIYGQIHFLTITIISGLIAAAILVAFNKYNKLEEYPLLDPANEHHIKGATLSHCRCSWCFSQYTLATDQISLAFVGGTGSRLCINGHCIAWSLYWSNSGVSCRYPSIVDCAIGFQWIGTHNKHLRPVS